jgi:hypothetical protein
MLASLQTRLKILSLNSSSSCVSDNGVMLLAHSLTKNAKLVSLDLTGAKIVNAGLGALGEALTQNRTLETLLLFRCGEGSSELSRAGLRIFAIGLALNSSIKKLTQYKDKLELFGHVDFLIMCNTTKNFELKATQVF